VGVLGFHFVKPNTLTITRT